jgi:acyl-coenzyme A thioesterase PaaI-like protein
MMDIKTHVKANTKYLGTIITLKDDCSSQVELLTSEEMIVDDKGLIHGGFTFGLADYAAMIAVNNPNVVLGSAECRFIAPVKISDKMTAKAVVKEIQGKRRDVDVEILVDDKRVFTGLFVCYVLDRHVLE